MSTAKPEKQPSESRNTKTIRKINEIIYSFDPKSKTDQIGSFVRLTQKMQSLGVNAEELEEQEE